ncbi:MAG: zinc ribbon domain-containing protein [Candidatus Methanomethylophilaceae archaeon]|nr:zinc ribbon domain-containing protein [Candidatus Methanomethylophilaceae archaeon]
MDNDSWNRVMMWISVIWLIVILFRLDFYTSYLSVSESGRIFSTVLNIILIIGLVLMGYIILRRSLPSMASRIDREGHCPQCHGKLELGAEFCPRCGAEIKR